MPPIMPVGAVVVTGGTAKLIWFAEEAPPKATPLPTNTMDEPASTVRLPMFKLIAEPELVLTVLEMTELTEPALVPVILHDGPEGGRIRCAGRSDHGQRAAVELDGGGFVDSSLEAIGIVELQGIVFIDDESGRYSELSRSRSAPGCRRRC